MVENVSETGPVSEVDVLPIQVTNVDNFGIVGAYEQLQRVEAFPLTSGRGILRSYYYKTNTVLLPPNVGLYQFDLEFRLKLVSNPFNSGLVCMSWVPFGPAWERTNTAALTNVPHVVANITEDTEVILKVPWCSTRLGASDTRPVAYGTLHVAQLTPARWPTGGVIPTVALFRRVTNWRVIANTEAEGQFALSGPNNFPAYVFSQGGGDPEQKAMLSPATIRSRMSGAISMGPVAPKISSYLSSVSWAAGALARQAYQYGFARPAIDVNVQRTKGTAEPYDYVVDAPSVAETMSNFTESSTDHRRFFVEDEDPMAFTSILSQWSQLAYGPITTGTNTLTPFFAVGVSPSALFYSTYASTTEPVGATICRPFYNRTLTTHQALMPTNIAYLAQCFRYWKGSMKFRFRFSGTKMHRMRILLQYCYDQGDNTGVMSFPVPGRPGPYSKIVEVCGNDTAEFEVPFIYDSPYCMFRSGTGTFSATLLSALSAPAAVSNTVDYIVEVCAGSDFELADFCGPRMAATNDTIFNPVVTTQGGFPRAVRVTSQGGISVAPDTISESTMGERFRSVKQLIAISKETDLTFPKSTTATTTYVFPHWFAYPGAAFSTNGVTRRESFAIGGYIANCFAYAKGGSEISFWSLIHNDVPRKFTYTTTSNLVQATNSHLKVSMRGDNVTVLRFPLFTAVPRVRTGCYGNWLGYDGLLTCWTRDTPTVYPPDPSLTQADGRPITLPAVHFKNLSTTTNYRLHIRRRAADDAALSWYLGPVPLVPGVNIDDTVDVFDVQPTTAPAPPPEAEDVPPFA